MTPRMQRNVELLWQLKVQNENNYLVISMIDATFFRGAELYACVNIEPRSRLRFLRTVLYQKFTRIYHILTWFINVGTFLSFVFTDNSDNMDGLDFEGIESDGEKHVMNNRIVA